MLIDMDIVVAVDYELDDPWPDGKLYPVSVKAAKFRGKDILNLMHVDHVMALQRRVYNRLIDSGMIKDGVYSIDVSDGTQ